METITRTGTGTGRIPMPLMNSVFCPGQAREAALAIADPELRGLALAEYAYFSGNHEEAAQLAEPYLSSDDPWLLLSACWVFGYASLSLGEVDKCRRVLQKLQSSVKAMAADADGETAALASFFAHGASILLHLPAPEGVLPLESILRILPPGMRCFALYLQAHRAYLQGRYYESIGIIQTTLALQADEYVIPNIYLHLVAAMAYISTRQGQKAKEHLLNAWELAQPDDLLGPLGEHHGLLGGLLEAVIKKRWPEDFRRIIGITARFSAGWRKVHKLQTGCIVADQLSTTEFSICMLAAKGWTNREISEHMGISTNTVKQHISMALSKLEISRRKDLKQFMLR